MTQTDIVKSLVAAGKTRIREIYEASQIRIANIRRILGQGAIKGEFKRVSRGIYVLSGPDNQKMAYIYHGQAQDVLKTLYEQGERFDMIFLDPPYFSRGLENSGNSNRKLIPFPFLKVDQFEVCMRYVSKLLRNDNSHCYLMLSMAPSNQRDMGKYLFAALENGLKIVDSGTYCRITKAGKAITNIRGKKSAPERLVLLTRSGAVSRGPDSDIKLNFSEPRLARKGTYPTQKASGMLEKIITQSTHAGASILDPYSGSGEMGFIAVCLQRIATLIDCCSNAIDNFIVPKFKSLLN